MANELILIVEDNDKNRKLLRAILKARDYETVEAANAEDGLVLARERRPALILMDIQLPGMDGLEATRRLKADPRTSGIPIVALTAHVKEADEAKAKEAGCSGYITKPIRLARFPIQVASYLLPEEVVAGE